VPAERSARCSLLTSWARPSWQHSWVTGAGASYYIELTAPSDFGSCHGGEMRTLKLPGGDARFFDQAGERERLWILSEYDRMAGRGTGTWVVITAFDFPGTPESDRAEIEEILQSVRIWR